MKSIISAFVLFCFCAFTVTSVGAQTLSKKSLVSDLNNSDGMKMDAKQKKDYESINARTADDLMEMDKSKKSKDDRDKEVDKIFDRRDNDIDKIWGNDSMFDDTRKTYKKKTRSLRLKIKAAKLVM